MENSALKASFGEKYRHHVIIRDHLITLAGGVVDHLLTVESLAELIDAVNLARRLKLEYVVIGQGSGVLFSDVGFAGLVILNRTNRISIDVTKSQVIADSGVLMQRLIVESASRDLTGLEFLSGLRGTVGGAAVMNRQANGVSLSQIVKSVTVLMPDGQVVTQPVQFMDYSEMSSRLTRVLANRLDLTETPELPVILTVTLQLSRNKKEEIMRKIQHFSQQNRAAWPLTLPSLGPIFKAYQGRDAEEYLTQAETKRLVQGRAKLVPKQPNFILTHTAGLGASRTSDIMTLTLDLQRAVAKKFDIWLEPNFICYGQWENDLLHQNDQLAFELYSGERLQPELE